MAQIVGPARLVKIGSQAVDDHGKGQVFHLQCPDGLGAQILIAHQLGGLDALGQQGAGPADGTKVDRAGLSHGLDHLRAALALADHAQLSQPQQGGGVGVHAVAGGGPGGADGLPGPGGRGAHIVDDRALDGEGEGLALRHQGAQPLMGGVPGGIDGAGEVDALSGPQAAAYLRGEGGGQIFGHVKAPR